MNAMISRFGLSPDDAKHVAHLSSGSFIKAMEAISLGEENKFFLEQFKAMMRNSWARNVKGMKAMADVMAGIGRERQKNFLSYCQHLIRENFMYRFQSPELNYMNLDEASFSVKFSPFVNERNVIDLMEELAKAERHITQNVNAKMVFFDLSLQITVLIKDKSSDFLVTPISFPQIEERRKDHDIIYILRSPANRHVRTQPYSDIQYI